MALTRAQYLSGNTANGVVLSGQPQGVRPGGTGISIASDGTIYVDASTVTGVVKLNNSTAYNNYVWPTSAGGAGQILLTDASANLSWSDPANLEGLVRTNNATAYNNYVWPTVTGTAGQVIVIDGSNNLNWTDPSSLGGLVKTNNPSAYNDYVWPTSAGTAGQVIVTDGSDNLSWEDPADLSGLVKTNNPSAYNNYVWPNATGAPDQIITTNGSGALSWTGNYVPTTSATGAAELPVGNTSQRPAGAAGYVRYNTSLDTLEAWNVGTASWGPAGGFSAGTRMLFAQAAAPSGWVQETDVIYNNSALRTVTTVGGGSGGTNPFTTSFTSYTPSGSVAGSTTGVTTAEGTITGGTTDNVTVTGVVSGSVAAHTLSLGQMPQHDHLIYGQDNDAVALGAAADEVGNVANRGSANAIFSRTSGVNGNYEAHTHGWSGSIGLNAHAHTVSATFVGTPHNHTLDGSFTGTSTDQFNVKYVDMLVCVKS